MITCAKAAYVYYYYEYNKLIIAYPSANCAADVIGEPKCVGDGIRN